jgi:hypothetical protein
VDPLRAIEEAGKQVTSKFVYRPSVTSLAEIRSGSSRRPVLFNGLPHRFGLVPDGHIKVFG